MTSAPRVSVGLPFFNAESTIALAVRSVLAQTFGDFELLLVNDGSTDASAEIAASFDDARIRVVDDGRNLGLVARLNQMSSLATGDYIARMDADDVCHPDRLARQVAWLDEHDDTDVVATGAWVIDDRERVTGSRHQFAISTDPAQVIGHGLLLHPTVMARRSWFLANPYDPDYLRAEDKELWARTWWPGRFHRLPEPLLYYREPAALRVGSYRDGCRSDRRVLRVYGPNMIGPVRTWLGIGRSLSIETATVAAHHLGLDGWVIGLRSQTPDSRAQADAQRLLCQMREGNAKRIV